MRRSAVLLTLLACLLQVLPAGSPTLTALALTVVVITVTLTLARPVLLSGILTPTHVVGRRLPAPLMRQCEPTTAGRPQPRAPGCGR